VFDTIFWTSKELQGGGGDALHSLGISGTPQALHAESTNLFPQFQGRTSVLDRLQGAGMRQTVF